MDRLGGDGWVEPRERGSRRERALRLLQAVGVVLAALFGASVAVGAVVPALLSAGVVAPDTVGAHVAGMVVQFGTFGVVVGLFVLGSGRTDLVPVSLPDRRGTLLAVGGYVVILALQFAFLWLLGVLEVTAGTNRVVELGRRNPALFLYLVPLSILVVGPAEELVFRGAVQGLLRRPWGPGPAIALASLVFGGVHYWAVVGPGPMERLLYVAIAAALGAVLGVVYEWTGNLVVPSLAHGVYNATLFVVQYLDVTGAL